MPLSTIRKLTSEDTERLMAMRSRFAQRHGIAEEEIDELANRTPREPLYSISLGRLVYEEEQQRLGHLYLAAFRRAMRHPSADSTGYGYLGWNVK